MNTFAERLHSILAEPKIYDAIGGAIGALIALALFGDPGDVAPQEQRECVNLSDYRAIEHPPCVILPRRPQ